MAWLPAYQALGQHPKTKRLARELGVGRPAAIGHLLLLWWWALDYAPNGCLERFSDGDLADAAEWNGDAAAFGAALREAGFIDQAGLHDWNEYGGRYLRTLATARERKAQWRARRAEPDAERQRPAAVPKLPQQPVVAAVAPPAAGQAVRKERGVRWPVDFKVTEEMTKWALAKGLQPNDISDQTYRLRDWAMANGAVKADWIAAWRGWIGRYLEQHGRRAA